MDGNICQTCLSTDRRLTLITKIKSLLDINNVIEVHNSKGVICWECKRLIEKILSFKTQVYHARRVLERKVDNPKCFSSLSWAVTKNRYEYQFYDFDPLSELDSKKDLIIVKEEVSEEIDNAEEEKREHKPKIDVDLNKAVTDIMDDEHYNDSNVCDIKPYLEEIMPIDYVENILKPYKSKKTRTKDHRLKIGQTDLEEKKTKVFHARKSRIKSYNKQNSKEIDKELRKKFSRVVLSVQQMVQSKEEKRNHPNFKKIPFKCDACVLGFTRKETYDIHMDTKHKEGIGKYMCDICKIRFPRKKPLERHCRHHYVVYKCNLCKYEAVEIGVVVNHCRLKHSEDSVNEIHCQQCTVIVKTAEELEEHVSKHHTLQCNQCGEKFKGKNTLRSHKSRIHGMKRDFTCDFCHKTFKTKTRLESHMVSHNEAVARRLSYCSICSVQYKNIYVYRNHLKNSANHSERAYNCPECNKKFASKVYWTKHYNFYHLRKSPYSCDICNKLFISDWRLKNHKQKHHGLDRPRDHTCNVCAKKFYTLSTLKAHQLTHSDQRSYMCEDCGDTFKQRPALYTHTKLVHKGVKRRKKQ